MMPSIHSQLTAMGRKASSASSMRPKENQRKKKTMAEQAKPM